MTQAIELLNNFKNDLQAMVPQEAQGFNVPDIIRQAESCLNENPALKACDPRSIATAVKYAVQLGLNIHGPLRQAYIVPYKNEAKFDLQYQGLIDLMARTDLYTSIKTGVVHQNDNFRKNEDDSISHSHGFSNRGPIVGFYAVACAKNGANYCELFTREEVEQLEKSTRKGNNITPAWKNWFGEMGRKSVVKRLIKWLPKTGGHGVQTLNRAIELDNESIDITPVETKSIEAGKESKKKMEESESVLMQKAKLESLLLDAQDMLNPDQYHQLVEYVKTDSLENINKSIDTVMTFMSEAK